MATQKIAITVPPAFLKRLDMWARKTGKPRSRFIVEEMEKRIRDLEDRQITKLYNEVYGNEGAAREDRELAEEMLVISAGSVMEDKW